MQCPCSVESVPHAWAVHAGAVQVLAGSLFIRKSIVLLPHRRKLFRIPSLLLFYRSASTFEGAQQRFCYQLNIQIVLADATGAINLLKDLAPMLYSSKIL